MVEDIGPREGNHLQDRVRETPLGVAFPASGERLLPGSFIEAWLARQLADGFGVQAVVLRLDDDMEWRVASVVEVTAASASVKSGPPRDGTEI